MSAATFLAESAGFRLWGQSIQLRRAFVVFTCAAHQHCMQLWHRHPCDFGCRVRKVFGSTIAAAGQHSIAGRCVLLAVGSCTLFVCFSQLQRPCFTAALHACKQLADGGTGAQLLTVCLAWAILWSELRFNATAKEDDFAHEQCIQHSTW
jgi:hypothetical protein